MERLLATYRQAHEFPRQVPRWARVKEEKAADGNSHSNRTELIGSERHFLMETTWCME